MSQFGMQLPGGQGGRRASMNVFTGLLFLALAAMIAASIVTYRAASLVSPDGKPWTLQQPGSITLP